MNLSLILKDLRNVFLFWAISWYFFLKIVITIEIMIKFTPIFEEKNIYLCILIDFWFIVLHNYCLRSSLKWYTILLIFIFILSFDLKKIHYLK